jgi:hypothetical protein
MDGIFNTSDEWLVATLEMPGSQYDGTDFNQKTDTRTASNNPQEPDDSQSPFTKHRPL